MSDVREFGYKRIWKIFIVVVSPVMFILGIIGVIDCYRDEYLLGIFITGIPLIIMSIFVFISPFIFKMRLGTDFIERICAGSKKIIFKDINKVWVSDNYIIIKSSGTTITIGPDIDKQNEIIGAVIDSIRHNQNIEIKGSKKNKRKYFPDRN